MPTVTSLGSAHSEMETLPFSDTSLAYPCPCHRLPPTYVFLNIVSQIPGLLIAGSLSRGSGASVKLLMDSVYLDSVYLSTHEIIVSLLSFRRR